jgi:hypothetical protein
MNSYELARIEEWHVPDIYEIQRAQQFLAWAYEGGHETAVQLYREKYRDAPCWVKDEPDGGLLTAINALWKLKMGVVTK